MSLVAGVLLRLLLVVDGDDAAAVVGHVWVDGVGDGWWEWGWPQIV